MILVNRYEGGVPTRHFDVQVSILREVRCLRVRNKILDHLHTTRCQSQICESRYRSLDVDDCQNNSWKVKIDNKYQSF
jgi:hypothetical protein